MPAEAKEAVIRAFARAIGEIEDYIPGPDMGTDEAAMAWVRDEIGRAVGLPRELGGIPLDEIGATGWGLAASAEAAQAIATCRFEGAWRCKGSARSAARRAAWPRRRACRSVGFKGTISDQAGLDIEALVKLKQAGRASSTGARARVMGPRSSMRNAMCGFRRRGRRDLDAERRALEGAVDPAGREHSHHPQAKRPLHERGVLSVPDFIANAGGVICASVEYHGGTQAGAFAVIREKILTNTRETLERSRCERITPRAAAEAMARERVERAMRSRRRQ
jgi:glutamate dehydrogenase (NAD(P)+)